MKNNNNNNSVAMCKLKSVIKLLILRFKVKNGKTRLYFLDPDLFYRNHITAKQFKNKNIKITFENKKIYLKSLLKECDDANLKLLILEFYHSENNIKLNDYFMFSTNITELQDIKFDIYFLLKFIAEGNLYFLNQLFKIKTFSHNISFTSFFWNLYNDRKCYEMYVGNMKYFYYCIAYASSYVKFVLPQIFKPTDDAATAFIDTNSRFEKCINYHIEKVITT
ncbi:Hypothetical protein Trvi_ORF110 [Trabala vishnou gigantina nucleopolyhedrovirus]|uniref:Hypothetical protein n=1 Tax=Trabala vishnou gigantina nucleopolyhedrovirus TaxID=2863583 RepID=UPI002481BD08|nr:Hypothetical protein QKU87_gp110 [Trabala vishnou gigantina nucleopolyhedrovirus]QYC92735.1 Hypothetical protein Trvi_ORF110 [Trabala vishnou gigantina nucleopolyhedrovirus]